MNTPSTLVALLLLGLAATAQGQTVYRCGNSYSQQPCPGGSTVDATDSRSPEQRKAHEASVKHEKRVADTLERTRHKEEAAAQRAAEQVDKAERAAEKKQKAGGNKPKSKDKLPAYRAPVTDPK
jgi:hypothetical protein